MKYVKQFGIILGISFVGELLHFIFPFPIPASIYGMVLMLILLCSKKLKLEQVKEVSSFLIEIMPMMFIPAAVGLMNSWGMIRTRLVSYSLVTIISLVCVMVATGWAAQWIIRRSKEDKV